MPTTEYTEKLETARAKATTRDAQETLAIQNMTDKQQAAYKAMSTTEKATHMEKLLTQSKSKLVESAFGEKTATAPKVKAETVTTTQ
ncbi:MAG TPA: hypothetical protein EYN66_09795 [Myxococcales bacterium]|nr:hypothetical protein [Myxococcales bacterium]